jgi:hypothetical protein
VRTTVEVGEDILEFVPGRNDKPDGLSAPYRIAFIKTASLNHIKFPCFNENVHFLRVPGISPQSCVFLTDAQKFHG